MQSGFLAVASNGRMLGLCTVRHLKQDEAVFGELLNGRRSQQLARNLAFSTIDAREKLVRRCVASINEWLAPGPTTRFHARSFVIWAGKNKRLPRTLDFPRRQPRSEPTMDEAWCQELIRRCVDDDRIALGTRVGALLLPVDAQPLARIAALECDDVIVDGENNTVAINLGDQPTLAPEPFGSLLVAHLRNRSNLNTGTVDDPWLFPSTEAGQHISPIAILHKLHT